MIHRGILLLVIVAVSLLARASAAGNGGVLDNTDANYVPVRLQVQNPGVTWTFATSGLSPGSDTVIHVQNGDDPQGGFIAGDDDGGGGLASSVVVPPAATTRTLVVVVRGYSASSSGTCTLTATPSTGTGWSIVTPFAGVPQPVGDLAPAAHVKTAERQGGTSDTIILAVKNFPRSYAVAFDDDDGVGLMSFMHLNEACVGCWVISGTFEGSGIQKTNVAWDDDPDTTDWDSDGLGQSLETAIGTNAMNGPSDTLGTDFDQDGLPDGDELFGVDSNPPVKFPYMGADPLEKDLFWEVDWIRCLDATKCPQGADNGQFGAGKTDAWIQEQIDTKIKAPFADANVRVHLDIGRANANSATWHDWGAWGGATQIEPGDPCTGAGISPTRAYRFHYVASYAPDAPGGGWPCAVPSPLVTSNFNEAQTITHETGHGMGLLHGGRPFAGALNHKPHYVSLMNYQYLGIGRFSSASSPVSGFNPWFLDEVIGLGQAGFVLEQLRNNWCPVTPYSNGSCVNLTTGAVDWNRDGVIQTGGALVQGVTAADQFSKMARSWFLQPPYGFGVLTDPALAWVSVGGSVGDQLWMFGRDDSNRLVWSRTPRTTLDANCGSFSTFYDEGDWNCARFGNPGGGAPEDDNSGVTTLVSPTKVLSFAPGAAEYGAKILVVYQPSSGSLKARLVTINSGSGAVSFGTEMTPFSGVTATGDVTALSTGTNDVTVWFRTGSGASARLRQIRYLNGSWSDQGNQVWNVAFPASPIVPMYGIGATRGYQDNDGTPSTYAAIPVYPTGLVEFVRKITTSSWSRVGFNCTSGSFGCVNGTASSWAGTGGSCPATSTDRPCTANNGPGGTQPLTTGRPGLAYQRRAGQPANVGRFYMAFNQGSTCTTPFGPDDASPPCNAQLVMTEGNRAANTPSSRRLTWITPSWVLYQFGEPVLRGISLVNDPARDANLRAAFGVAGNQGIFEPIADGIINTFLSDYDDITHVQNALRASLCLDGGTWPNQCVLPPDLQ